MSDHVDGPRSIGDPSIDLTDLFAFTSPEDPGRTVLVANVFPSAGVSALFSNVVNHSVVVRRMTVAGLGEAAKFKPGDQEYRFNCKFTALERGTDGSNLVQKGTCTFPGGQEVTFVVNDEKGTSTPDGVFRVFAGLRSDPFYLAWLVAILKKFPNLLEHDNVLSIVIDFDTKRVLDPDKGPLFGAIAETSSIPQPRSLIGHEPPRFDWVGRPEQTNMRLNNPAMAGTDDVRDLWNQMMPFALAEEFQPIFRKRLLDSLTNWDMRDGKADWTPEALTAVINVYLDDFLLFDVTKPTTDTSFLEIEKSTLHGHPYKTGGGRTVNANVIDIMLTWMVNNDREFLQGGALGATKPGVNSFPFLASPNTQIQTAVESVELAASPDKVWALIGDFGAAWEPLIASINTVGTGVGQIRVIETIDGKRIIERLEAIDNSSRSYRYAMLGGIQATDYKGTLSVTPKGTGSIVEWKVQYWADGQPDILVKTVVTTLLNTSLESLKARFGASK
jgi:Domain of unknown function (DUF4331)/Polyketide cyclase / dehydrase and lipid transport